MRLLFRVIEVSERIHWKDGAPNTFKVKLRPTQTEENRRWFAAIPDRPIEIEVLTAEAATAFEVGAEVSIDVAAVSSSAPAASAASPATGEKPAPSGLPDEIC